MRIKSPLTLERQRLKMQKLREKRKQAALCVDCGQPAEGKIRCAACREAQMMIQRARRYERMEANRCVDCNIPLPPPEEWCKVRCEKCHKPYQRKPKVQSPCKQCGTVVEGYKEKDFCSRKCKERFELPDVPCAVCHQRHNRRNQSTDRFLLTCSEFCQRVWNRSRGYDISPAQLKALLEQQEGKCAICGIPGDLSSLNIDHCHKEGHVRGLLCHGCNVGLGLFKESVTALKAAADYLAA